MALTQFNRTAPRHLASRMLPLAALLLAQYGQAATHATFYVSPTGNDSASGLSSAPLRTLARARDVVRAVNKNMTGDIIINVAAGNYFLSSTLALTELDSGTNGHHVIWRSAAGAGAARLIGGTRVTNWVQHSGNIFKANVGSVPFHTLYENETRAVKARYPNLQVDPAFPLARASYLIAAPTSASSYWSFNYKEGDLNPAGWSLRDAQIVHWEGPHWDWFTGQNNIASVDPISRTFHLAEKARYPYSDPTSGARYFVQGVLQLLDQPGEFHHDRLSGTLYYWPRNASIAPQTVIVPRLQRLVSIRGSSPSAPARNIRLDGFFIGYSDFTDFYRYGVVSEEMEAPPAEDSAHKYPVYNKQVEMRKNRHGLVYLESSDHITITDCHLKNGGFSAIYAQDSNQYNRYENNLIENLGHSGIYLQGRYPGEGDVNRFNTVTNSVIRHVGELVGHAAGVYVWTGHANEVSFSEIHGSPRYAVMFGSIPDLPAEDVYVSNNRFRFLKISNTNQDSGDTGAIYAFGISRQSLLTNFIGQVTVDQIFNHPSVQDIGTNGIFMDNGSHGQTFANVKVGQTTGLPFRENDSGNHNFQNVSWMPGFNESAMDYSHIRMHGLRYEAPLSRAGWRVSAFSHYQSDDPDRAIDYNSSTRWASGALQAPGQWFQIDLGATKTFSGVELVAGGRHDYPRGFSIFVSNDGVSWGAAVATGKETSVVTRSSFPAKTARYIRIQQTANDNPGLWWTISEVNVFSKQAPPPRRILEAENNSGSQNVVRNAGYVGSCDNGDWIRFDGIDFNGGYSAMRAHVAVENAFAGQTLEIRIDDPMGPLLGTLVVQGTGSWTQFTPQTAPLTPAKGVHSVYFVFRGTNGIGNFDSFELIH